MLCFGLSCVLGERDLGDIELGEWSGELAIGGEGMERGLGGHIGNTQYQRKILRMGLKFPDKR